MDTFFVTTERKIALKTSATILYCKVYIKIDIRELTVSYPILVFFFIQWVLSNNTTYNRCKTYPTGLMCLNNWSPRSGNNLKVLGNLNLG